MYITELYKIHINPDASPLEIHNFMKNFDIGAPYVPHPNEKIKMEIEKNMITKMEIAKQFILKNSKLKI